MRKKSPFPARDVIKLVTHLRDQQGCKVKRTTKGYWIGFPDGTSTAVHLTSSDVRAVRNTRARVERSGCTWPL